jgi:hypothetical protein
MKNFKKLVQKFLRHKLKHIQFWDIHFTRFSCDRDLFQKIEEKVKSNQTKFKGFQNKIKETNHNKNEKFQEIGSNIFEA